MLLIVARMMKWCILLNVMKICDDDDEILYSSSIVGNS